MDKLNFDSDNLPQVFRDQRVDKEYNDQLRQMFEDWSKKYGNLKDFSVNWLKEEP